MTRRAGPSVRSRRLTSMLRKLRTAAELSTTDVAKLTGLSSSKVSRIETMDIGIYRDDLERLLDCYRVSRETRIEMLDLARHAEQRGMLRLHGSNLPEDWQTWVDFESEASELLSYEPLMVPGLLQTSEYADAIIRATGPQLSEAEVDTLVASRMARQGLLSRSSPVTLHAVIEQGVLNRPLGESGALMRQLRHLADAATKPNVTIQVMPTSTGLHSGMNGPFVVLGYDSEPSLVLLENKVSSLFLDEAEHIEGYRQVWAELCKRALSPQDSAEFLADTAASPG